MTTRDEFLSATSAQTGLAPAGKRAGFFFLFFAFLAFPVIFTFGTIALPAYRIFLLLVFAPVLFSWITGRAGTRNVIDFLFAGYAFWSVLALLANHPLSRAMEPAGSLVLETIGPYLLGRAVMRTPDIFETFVKFNFGLVLLMLPLAIIETQTGSPFILRELSKYFVTVTEIDYPPRMGLERAQVIFDHPILFGVFAAASFVLVVQVLNRSSNIFISAVRSGVVLVATVASVSSGALLVVILQFVSLTWDRVLRSLKSRWTIFMILFAMAYITVDLLSNRTPFHVFVSYLTFNMATSYNRILIFEYGMDNVVRNPLFGLGLKDWARPFWMKPSIDNFWLVITMRYGVPALLFLVAAIGVLVRRLAKKSFSTDRLKRIRAGYLMSLLSVMVGVVSVHIWGNVYIWVMFFIGAGVAMLDWDDTTSEQSLAEPESTRRGPVYRRQFGDGAAAGGAKRSDGTDDKRVPGTSVYTRFPTDTTKS